MKYAKQKNYYFIHIIFSEDDISKAIYHLKDTWGIEQIRMGMGSFISLDNVYKTNFYRYEGLYTTTLNAKSVFRLFYKVWKKIISADTRKVLGIDCRFYIKKLLDYARK